MGSDASPAVNSLSDLSYGNPAIVNNINFHVKGSFDIDIPARFGNCDIIVDSDGEITISDPNVQIRHTDFSSCDDEMWNGITLTSYAGLLFNCSSVKDAEYAIRLYYHNRLAMEYSLFEDNYIGIYAPALPGNTLLTQYVLGCTFQTNSGLKDPGNEEMQTTTDNRGYAGVYVSNIGYFPLGTIYGKKTECLLVEPDPDDVINHFEDLHSGIIAYNTSLDIERTTFKDIMHTTINGNNMAIREVDNCIYSDGRKGLYYLNQTGLGSGILSMDNCQTGIQTNGLSQAELSSNKMTVPKAGFVMSHGNGGHFSIHHNLMDVGIYGVLANDNLKLSGLDIHHMQISLEDWGSTQDPRAGMTTYFGPPNEFRFTESSIEVDACDDVYNRGTICWKTFGSTIQDVTIEEIASHLSFVGMSFNESNAGFVHNNVITGIGSTSGAWGIGVDGCWGTSYTCNKLDDTGVGLFMNFPCDYSPIVGNYFDDHETGLYYNYGSSNAPRQINAGNQWLGSSYTNAARNDEVNIFLSSASGFDVHDDEMPWFPDPIIQSGDWFRFDSNLDEPVIDCGDLGNLSPELDTTYLLAVIDTSEFPDIDFKEGRQFWAQWHLFGALMDGTAATTNTDVSDWYDDQEEEPLGELYAINLNAQFPLSSYSTLVEDIEENLADQVIAANKYLVKQEEYVDIVDTLSAEIDDSLAILLSDLHDIISDGIDLRHEADSIESEVVSDLISDLTGITCTSILDSNIQRVLFVQLNSIHSGIDTLTTSQRNNLRNVADQCALVGGPGVSMARSFLQIFGVEDSWSTLSGCTMPSQISGLNDVKFYEDDISLSPNPINRQILLEASKTAIVGATLYDIKGVIVASSSWEASLSHVMNLPELSKGVYILKIINVHGTQVVKKLIRQ